jgi:hypothetical protein
LRGCNQLRRCCRPGRYVSADDTLDEDEANSNMANYLSSDDIRDENDPNANGDNNDNGVLASNGAICSGVFTLGNGEPLGENPDNDLTTPDADENLMLDFSFFAAPTALDKADEPRQPGRQLFFIPLLRRR